MIKLKDLIDEKKCGIGQKPEDEKRWIK